MAKYPSHTSEIPRINRVIGQLEAVKRMIEADEYCVNIISQLRAARNATKTIELGVLERHMGACMKEACCSGKEQLKDKKIEEIINLLRKYE